MGVRGDTRGVAPVVGAVLIFAFIVVALSSYQAFVVPNENVQIEFDHAERVEGQMLNVRNAILDVRSTQRDNFVTVELGTRYPARVFSINPPHPTGTIETTDPRDITIYNANNELVHACPGVEDTDPWSGQSRMLTYVPNYNELNPPTAIRYENSVAYKQYEDRYVLLSGQRMFQGDTITIVPLEREFSASGRQTVSIEPMVGRLDTTQVEDPTLTFPTELDEETWLSLLEDQERIAPENVTVADGELTLDLTGTFRVRCGPVGIGEEPASGTGDVAASDINPAAPGDIRLETETLVSGTSSEVQLRFNNTEDTNSITEARINFYNAREGGTHIPDQATIRRVAHDTSATLVFREDMETLDPKIELAGGETTSVVLNFTSPSHDDPNLNRQSFFVITLVLETGESGLYFVPVPSEFGEGNLDSIQFDLDPETIETGEDSLATVRAIYDDGTWEDVTTLASYDVDDEFVANETATGVFTGESEGVTTITAEYEEGGVTRTDTAELTVTEETVLDSITLELDPTTIEISETSQSTVIASYTDGSTADVTTHENTTYTSSNETVASVNDDGIVTGLAEGTSVITANYTEDGITETDTAGVTVSDDPEPASFDVNITGTNSPVTEGETMMVDVTVTNTGDVEDTQLITLTDTDFSNTVQDSIEVTLDGTESNDSITLEWETNSSDIGTGDITVQSENDSDTATVTVEEAAPDEASLVVQPFTIEDKLDDETFTVNITVEELADVETENLVITLAVENDTGTEVYNETITNAGEIQDGSVTVEFGMDDSTPPLGPFDAEEGDYTATATASADNADDATETETFNVDEQPTMAEQTDFVTDSGSGTAEGVVTFDLQNTGTESVTITALRIDSVTGSPAITHLDNGANNEFQGAGGFINIPGSISVDAENPTAMSQNATIGAQNTNSFTLQQFRQSNNNVRDMADRTVTVTIYFSDGSSGQYIIQA